jgi:hypothetical protein
LKLLQRVRWKHWLLYDRKHDCVIKKYDVIVQLVDARATRPFPFPAPKIKKVKGLRFWHMEPACTVSTRDICEFSLTHALTNRRNYDTILTDWVIVLRSPATTLQVLVFGWNHTPSAPHSLVALLDPGQRRVADEPIAVSGHESIVLPKLVSSESQTPMEFCW